MSDDGKSYATQHYNLDAIIAVGFRVRGSAARSSASGPRTGT